MSERKRWKIEICKDYEKDIWVTSGFVYDDFHTAVRGAMTLTEYGRIARVREVKKEDDNNG